LGARVGVFGSREGESVHCWTQTCSKEEDVGRGRGRRRERRGGSGRGGGGGGA